MDPETAGQWNAWLKSHLMRERETIMAATGDVLGTELGRIDKEIASQIMTLRAAAAALSSEVDALRGEVGSLRTALAAARSGVQRGDAGPRAALGGRHAPPRQH